MNEAKTQEQRAVAMTSLHPPTNPHLLRRWRDEAKDEDLQKLITSWMQYLDGKIKAFDYVKEYDSVHLKVKTEFYKKG
jgi:hypothetical protein